MALKYIISKSQTEVTFIIGTLSVSAFTAAILFLLFRNSFNNTFGKFPDTLPQRKNLVTPYYHIKVHHAEDKEANSLLFPSNTFQDGAQNPTWHPDDLLDVFSQDTTANTQSTFLVILIASSPENFSRRKAIRKTWSCGNISATFTWTAIFLIGQTQLEHINILLDNESSNNGDILRGGYMDTYRNLTFKVLHGIMFLTRNPPKFVLKTDDDCFVNVHLLVTLLSGVTNEKLYTGYLQRSLEVIRKPSSKWFVPLNDYESNKYPVYASGIGYVMSGSLLKNLEEVSLKVKPFPNEDAYMGVLMSINGIVPVHSERFSPRRSYASLRLCNYAYVVVIHRVFPSMQFVLHKKALKAMDTCKRQHFPNCEFQSECND